MGDYNLFYFLSQDEYRGELLNEANYCGLNGSEIIAD